MELFRFSAPAGKYVLELTEGSSINMAENTLIRLLPVKMVDYDKYFIQIRETKPVFHILAGIVLLLWPDYALFADSFSEFLLIRYLHTEASC